MGYDAIPSQIDDLGTLLSLRFRPLCLSPSLSLVCLNRREVDTRHLLVFLSPSSSPYLPQIFSFFFFDFVGLIRAFIFSRYTFPA